MCHLTIDILTINILVKTYNFTRSSLGLQIAILEMMLWYGNSLFDTIYKYTLLNILHN